MMTDSIKIIHDCCFKSLKSLEKHSVDLVLTDPPYFIDKYDDKWEVANAKESKLIGGIPSGMRFDPKDGIRLENFISTLGRLLDPIIKPGAFALFFTQPRLSHRMAVGLENVGFEIRDVYTWYYMDKGQFKAFSMDHFIDKLDTDKEHKEQMKTDFDGLKTAQVRPQFESIILAQKPKEGTFVENWQKYQTGLMNLRRFNDKMPTSVMQFKKDKRESFNTHPTVKPIALMEHLIKMFSLQNQLVLDPFLGSGTTALAAKHTMRRCIGIEKKSEYVNIAQERLKQDNLLFNFA